MKLYRFSPIKTEEDLKEALRYVYYTCHELCKKTFGSYLPNIGNIVIFCHYEEEYQYLDKIKKDLTTEANNIGGKYFKLKQPIIMPKQGSIPQTKLTYLYIRQPDPWRSQVGDLDVYLEPTKYEELKRSIVEGKSSSGLRIFPRDDLDMIEMYDPDIDVLAYVRAETL